MLMSILFSRESSAGTGWQPPADIYRTASGWVIKFDLAGVRPEDVSVNLLGASITVRGIRRDWVVEKDWQHYSMEISYSRFERTIELPCDLTRTQVATECRSGMLLIRITSGGDQV